MVLADAEGGKLQIITFYNTEEDYQRGDQTLQGMNPPEGMNRSSVGKYEVTVRRTA